MMSFAALCRKYLSGTGLALCFGCMNAFGADPAPTVAEAHDFLTGMFQRYAVKYVVWYGNAYDDNYGGRVASYSGNECRSELRFGEDSARAYAIDWSVISTIANAGPREIYFTGQIVRTPHKDGDRYFGGFQLDYPDTTLPKSAFNAFELLRRSCKKTSKFD